MGEKKTKEDWYNHIRHTIEITNSCVVNHISCSDCIDIFGPCRKNIAINKFGNLVEQVLD